MEPSEERGADRVADDDAIAAGWYRDPAAPETQRYWDGEEWLGEPIAADATPPATPPTKPPAEPPAPAPARADAPATPQPTPQPSTAPPGDQPWPMPPSTPPSTPTNVGAPPAKLAGFPFGTPGYTVVLEFMATHRKAPLVRRFAARMIDIFAVLALNAVVNGWFVYQFLQEILPLYQHAFAEALAGRRGEDLQTGTERSASLTWAILLIGVALWFAYEVPATAHDGQTFGKRLLGIRVTRLDGAERLGFATAFRRWSVMSIPAFLFPCGLLLQALDSLWCTWDRPLEQCYHDKVARTAVVVKLEGDQPDADPAAGPHRET